MKAWAVVAVVAWLAVVGGSELEDCSSVTSVTMSAVDGQVGGDGMVALAGVAQASASLMFVSTAGTLYRSQNSGGQWAPQNRRLPDFDTATTRVSRLLTTSEAETLWIAAATSGSSSPALLSTLWKTTDFGNSYTRVNTPLRQLFEVHVHPTQPGRLLLVGSGTQTGRRSAYVLLGASFQRVVVHDAVVTAAWTGSGDGLLVATAAQGQLFYSASDMFAAASDVVVEQGGVVALQTSAAGVVFALTNDTTYASVDAGRSFQPVQSVLPLAATALLGERHAVHFGSTVDVLFTASSLVADGQPQPLRYGSVLGSVGQSADGSAAVSLLATLPGSVLAQTASGAAVQSINNGVDWQPVAVPASECQGRNLAGQPCLLGLFAGSAPAPVSSAAAPALVVANGYLGQGAGSLPVVVVSQDGGVGWTVAADGHHYIAVDELANLVVLVPLQAQAHQPGAFNFLVSADQGRSWSSCPLDLHASGLQLRPSHFSAQLVLLLSAVDADNQVSIVQLNFRPLLSAACTAADVHDETLSACYLPGRPRYVRKNAQSTCWLNGTSLSFLPCPCSAADYACDMCSARSSSTGACALDPQCAAEYVPPRLPCTGKYLPFTGYVLNPGSLCAANSTPADCPVVYTPLGLPQFLLFGIIAFVGVGTVGALAWALWVRKYARDQTEYIGADTVHDFAFADDQESFLDGDGRAHLEPDEDENVTLEDLQRSSPLTRRPALFTDDSSDQL